MSHDDDPAVAATAPATPSGETLTERARLGDRAMPARELPFVDPAHYAIGDEIAHGGMGRIRAARDLRLDREVALKELLEPGGDLALRFEREALVTARLQHPSIVAVYEAGRWPSGEPFYAMKLVRGRPLKAVIGRAATLDARLALVPHVGAIADAMAYAHDQRIVHRDLKPSNVLVGDFGETVVIDWGLAKDLAVEEEAALGGTPSRSSDASLTRAGSVMGTPNYMPPEQARGEAVDERADVYAIGAILYHALSGEPPFADHDAMKVVEAVALGPPAPLGARVDGLAPDLLAIVERAMARDPAARYRTARELAEDLRRFQTGQLVASHRYTRGELLRRFVRRHRAVLAIAGAALAMFAVSGTLAVRAIVAERDAARAERSRADQQRELAEGQRKTADAQREVAVARGDALAIARAEDLVGRDPAQALEVLAGLSPGSPAWRAARTLATIARDRGIPRRTPTPDGDIERAIMSADGSHVLTASHAGLVRLWDTATWHSRVLDRAGPLTSVGCSRDAGVCAGGTLKGAVHVWSGQALPLVLEQPAGVYDLAVSADGKWLVSSGNDDMLRIWSLASHAVVAHFDEQALAHIVPAQRGTAMLLSFGGQHARFEVLDAATQQARPVALASSVASDFSPDGTRLRYVRASGEIIDVEVASGRERTVGSLAIAKGDEHPVGVSFAPDGVRFATVNGGRVRLWDHEASRPIGNEEHATGFSGFSPDGAYLEVDSAQPAVWNLETGERTTLPRSNMLGFPGDHRLVAWTGTALWNWPLTTTARSATPSHDPVHQVSYLADGRLLVIDGAGTVELAGHRLALPVPVVGEAAKGPDRRRIAVLGHDGIVRLVELATGAITALAPGIGDTTPRYFPDDPAYFAAAIRAPPGTDPHPHGTFSFQTRRDVRVRREQGGHVAYVRFSPDGRSLAAFTPHGALVHVWDLATGAHHAYPIVEPQHAAPEPYSANAWMWGESAIEDVRFALGGRALVAGDSEGRLVLVDLRTGTTRVLGAEAMPIEQLAATIDGRGIVAATIDHVIHRWDLVTGQSMVLVTLRSATTWLARSSAGTFAAGGEDGHVELVDAPQQGFDLRGAPVAMAFSPDATRLAVADGEGKLVIRDLVTGISRELTVPGTVAGDLAWSPDGTALTAACDDGTVRTWRDDLPRDEAGLRAWLAHALGR